jgi:hypothetical protein
MTIRCEISELVAATSTYNIRRKRESFFTSNFLMPIGKVERTSASKKTKINFMSSYSIAHFSIERKPVFRKKNPQSNCHKNNLTGE